MVQRSEQVREKQDYTIWIEAEEWPADQWTPDGSDTDVIVSWEAGDRWVASFISYKHIKTLTDKNKQTGEHLSGAYFWTSDMILIDEVSRQRIEAVIHELISTHDFEVVFSRLPDEE